MHHAAGHRPGLVDLNAVPHPRQVIGGGQAAGAGADHQHPLAAGRGGHGELPVFLQGQIAQKPLDGVDADRGIELAAIAGGLAGMVADPAVDTRHRVVLGQTLPSLLETARLRVRQPSLDVLARRTGVVAGGQQIHVDRPLDALRADVALLVRQIQRTRHIDGLVSHRASLRDRLVVRDNLPLSSWTEASLRTSAPPAAVPDAGKCARGKGVTGAGPLDRRARATRAASVRNAPGDARPLKLEHFYRK